MTSTGQAIHSLWWLIQKDLTRERRAQHVWPGMTLLGVVLVFLLAAQLDLPVAEKSRIAGGLLWLAIFVAGTLTFDRSFSGEREAGCWMSLSLFPIDPSILFLGKMAVNLIALAILEFVLVPAFIVFTDVSLASQPGPLLLVLALGNVGFAAVGTLVGGLMSGLRYRGGLLTLLLLPLVVPVILGSAEATRILLCGEIDSVWWRWIQLLAVFSAVFTVSGSLLFEYVMED